MLYRRDNISAFKSAVFVRSGSCYLTGREGIIFYRRDNISAFKSGVFVRSGQVNGQNIIN